MRRLILSAGFGLLFYVLSRVRRHIAFTKIALDSDRKRARLDFDALKREEGRQKETNSQLEREVLEISRLYDVTKDLSAALELAEVLNVLCNFLAENFSFSSAYLLTAQDEGSMLKPKVRFLLKGAPCTRTVQGAPPDSPLRRDEPLDYESGLLDILYATREHIAIASARNSLFKEKLKLPAGVQTLLAVPMIFGARDSYVLVVENSPASDFERLLVLAGQLLLGLEKINLYREVQELAIVDGLTGILVRRHFMERFTQELARSARHGSNLALLLLDIDDFKRVNDAYGHLVGDAILKEMAGILKRNVREVDLLARYGGEEFAIALTDTTKVDAYNAGERIRQAIEECGFRAYDETPKVAVSIGISGYPVDGLNPQELLEGADQALYRAKESGKNKVVLF